jgi:hypothetical protein
MIRITILLSLLLIPTIVLAQTTQCSSFNFNPTIFDVRIENFNEHSTGSHVVATGPNVGIASSSVTATCNYAQPPAGTNTCQTTCGVSFNPGALPIQGETGTLTVPGSHDVSFTAISGTSGGGGAISCSAQFGMTVLNQTDKTPTVFSQINPITVSCPTETLPTPTPTPTPVPTPIPTPTPPASKPGQPCDNDPTAPGGGGDQPTFISGCSPIILDSEGEGFHLTSASAGVMFDISGTGTAIRIAWTDPAYHNGFLALPGTDGLVHNGKQLFGNFTPQPSSVHPNGFLALAEYDKPENGGNGDGIIDERDAVFSRLRLWIDANHDGICQPNELHPLAEMNIYSLALGYFASGRTDEFGNQFRYKARVNPDEHRDKLDETPTGDPGRWAYDVFFVTK